MAYEHDQPICTSFDPYMHLLRQIRLLLITLILHRKLPTVFTVFYSVPSKYSYILHAYIFSYNLSVTSSVYPISSTLSSVYPSSRLNLILFHSSTSLSLVIL